MQTSTRRSSSSKQSGPNLSRTTEVGRKVVKYSAILLVSYMVLSVVIRVSVAYYRYLNPPAPAPPTMGFNLLPPIDFPEEFSQDFPEELVISIPREKLSNFPNRATVYFYPKQSPSLLADERVRGIANKLNFTGEPEIMDVNSYRWYKYQPIDYVFEIDLVSYNFFLRSDFQTRPELLVSRAVPEEQQAVKSVKTYLSRIDLLPQDLATSSGEIRYLKSLAGELFEAVSLSDATFLEVNLNRASVDGQYKIYNPQVNRGIVSAIVSNALGANSILDLKYNYYPLDYTKPETYPIKSINAALAELESGEAYVASEIYLDEAIVRDVFLGYFEDYDYQPYLQPIYVFEGDDGFVAYVSAIHSSAIEQ